MNVLDKNKDPIRKPNRGFSERLDAVFASWSADGRQISKPLKVTFIAFLVVTVLTLTAQNALNEYRNLSKPIIATTSSAKTLLAHQKQVAALGLEQALLGISSGGTLKQAMLTGNRIALTEAANVLYRELAIFHSISELSIYNPDLNVVYRAHELDLDVRDKPGYLLNLAKKIGVTTRGFAFDDNGFLSITAVRPWIVDGHIIGYLKLSRKVDEVLAFIGTTLKAQVIKVYREDSFPFGSAAALAKVGWAQAGPYVYKNTSHQSLADGFASYLANSDTEKSLFDRIMIDDGRLKIAHRLIIPHADRTQQTAVVLLQDMTEEFAAFLRSSALSLAVGFVLAYGFWLIFNRLILALQQLVVSTRARLEREVEENTEELQASRNRLQAAQKIASIGSWELDLVSKQVHWSDEMYQIAGLDPRMDGNTAQMRLFSLLPKDTVELIETSLKQAADTSRGFDFEHEIIRPDGSTRHIHVRGNILSGEFGEATKVFATSHDITEWHRAQQQNLMLADILEASMNEVYLIDAETLTIEYANACGRENLGYTMEELAECTVQDISPEMGLNDFKALVRPLREGKDTYLKHEGHQLRKDGSTYPVEVRFQNYLEHDRDLFVAIAIDVTERAAREQEIRQAKEEAEHIAYYDTLTQLANRACCHKQAAEVFAPGRKDKPAFLIHMDLDNFKRINDTLGHLAGDHCLEQSGQRLREVCEGLATAYRWGGDEFVIIANSPDVDPETLCERAQSIMRAPMEFEGNQIWPSVSMGIARCPDDGDTFPTLLVHADLALYSSKEKGKDRWSYFSSHMKIHSDAVAETEKELRQAISNDEFFLVFQPQVNIRTQSVTGVEALVRWRHPTKGIVAPGAFLPVVEKTNLAAQLGQVVLDKALSAARAWTDLGHRYGRIAVNISPSYLASGSLLDDFASAMKKYGIAPAQITAEVLESVFLDDKSSDNSKVLEELHKMGVHIELDDFGTGFASLSHVADLPINALKIDRTFTARLLNDFKKEIVVNQLIHLARALDIGVICEGVETEAQFQRLRMMGNFSVQGYLIARPMEFDSMSDWLKASSRNALFVI
ncbi:putative bifunctional diguanylate cyclase/phosphodiesterase [Roseibium sediminis]|uniref:putative bifunctional diguanylate cyclase/phosphodiesterase n=1 Tax=Roseibium sediminis TaxID=1775174 RepID=UPI001375C68A|nr:EAL domain-containing protein [Roseibium sediminis]